MIGTTCQRFLIETYEGDLVMLSPNSGDIYFLHVYVNTHTNKPPLPIPLLISSPEHKNSSVDKCFYKVIFSQSKA